MTVAAHKSDCEVVPVLRDITNLLDVILWPLAVLVILLFYRRHLPTLASAVMNRVSGVTLPGFSLSFAVASEPSPQAWSALNSIADPLAPESVPDSGNALFALVNAGERVDSARFDLRAGRSWLTSRLFIFSMLLPEVLNVRCMVFTETRDGVARRFVGLGEPNAVAAALAREFDWLLPAWTRASVGLSYLNDDTIKEVRALAGSADVADWQLQAKLVDVVHGALYPRDLEQPGMAESVARSYLTDGQIRRERPKAASAEPGWVRLRELDDGNVREEHALWISNGAHLDDLLGRALTRPHIVETAGITARQLNRQAVTAGGPFVAVVDVEGRFLRLLHRETIVEQIASEAADNYAGPP